MKTIFLIIEFITAILLIAGILLHSAKGEGMGSLGGQGQLFKSQKGLESGLSKITGVLGCIFLFVTLVLSFLF